MTRSCERDREVPDGRESGVDDLSVSDWDIVSEEHSAVGDEVKAVVGEVGDLDGTLGCAGGSGAVSLFPALVCCCSHISLVLGSTGQLVVLSGLSGGGRDIARDGDEAVAGGSAFHHPMILLLSSPLIRLFSSPSYTTCDTDA